MTESIVAKIGLELVLENLAAFRRGMLEARRENEAFAASGKGIERALEPVNKLLGIFLESLRRIGEFVIANIITRGIEKITSAIRDMVDAMITAGSEFQTLTIRLEGLLARELIDSGQVTNFTDALELAIPAAEDLFFWIQKLALTTPFDIQDIATTITFAHAYGFAGDEAKRVTSAIVDFASGMGLSNVQMQRIIENFGQMIQQGKVTSTELRDLGRGALVPINRILEDMRMHLGLTTEAFNDLRKEGGLKVEDFVNSFIKVVGEDFPNAARRASRTIQAVLGNINDLLQGLLGFNVVRPILDVIADKLAGIIDALTTGVRGDYLLGITKQMGEALADIVSMFIGLAPGEETIADWIIEKLDIVKGKILGLREIVAEVVSGGATLPEGISAALILLGLPPDFVEGINTVIEKLSTVKESITAIVTGFQEGGLVGGLEAAGAPPAIIGFIENIQTALENIKLFWDQNKDQIIRIIDNILGTLLKTGEVGGETLLEVIGGQLVRFSDTLVEKGPGILDFLEDFSITLRDDLMPRLRDLGDWISEHQDTIINFFIAWKILGQIAPILAGLAIVLFTLNPLFLEFLGILSGITFIVMTLPSFIDTLVKLNAQLWLIVALIGQILWTGAVSTFSRLWDKIKEIAANIINEMVWAGYRAMMGFANEFFRVFNWFKENVWIVFRNFISWLKALLGIHSDSKVFEKIGMFSGMGYATGFIKGIESLMEKTELSFASNIMPAMSNLPAGATSNTTNNFSLYITSSAQREPLIADFRQLEALAS